MFYWNTAMPVCSRAVTGGSLFTAEVIGIETVLWPAGLSDFYWLVLCRNVLLRPDLQKEPCINQRLIKLRGLEELSAYMDEEAQRGNIDPGCIDLQTYLINQSSRKYLLRAYCVPGFLTQFSLAPATEDPGQRARRRSKPVGFSWVLLFFTNGPAHSLFQAPMGYWAAPKA